MNADHLNVLTGDLRAARDPGKKAEIAAKLLYYRFQRPLAGFVFNRFYRDMLPDAERRCIDRFLLNEGGMFKKYVYGICDRFRPIRDASVLVPGVGYGRNLFQLAAFKPKKIVAFDPYGYPEEWELVRKRAAEDFRVPVSIYRGEFDALPDRYAAGFDFIISDAVLEHVNDLGGFLDHSSRFLKTRGIFYAGFGPIWFGPGGDHIDWGREGLFDHLLLPPEEYGKRVEDRRNRTERDSCQGVFMAGKSMYSYLKAGDYFRTFREKGFKKLLAFAKISTRAIRFFRENPSAGRSLDEKGVPRFDRICKGLSLWFIKESVK